MHGFYREKMKIEAVSDCRSNPQKETEYCNYGGHRCNKVRYIFPAKREVPGGKHKDDNQIADICTDMFSAAVLILFPKQRKGKCMIPILFFIVLPECCTMNQRRQQQTGQENIQRCACAITV